MLNSKTIDGKIESSIWRNRSFLSLWVGSIISSVSISFYSLALPLIIYRLTESTLAMSTMRAIEIFPNIVLGMLIGAIVDRVNRKKFMLIVIGMQATLILTLVLLLKSPDFSLIYLYIIGFLFYTMNYSFSNSFQSTIPLIVEKEQLIQANSIRTLSNTLISIMSPALAGIILFSFSYENSLVVTLFGYMSLFLCIALVALPHKERYLSKNKKNLWLEMKEGFRYLVNNKVMWFLTLVILFINIASAASGAILIFFSMDTLNLNERELGVVISFSAIGGILASIIAKKIKDKLGIHRILIGLLVLMASSQLILFVSSNIYYLFVAMFLAGYSVTTINIYYHTLRQALTPPELLGRIGGTTNMITMLATPFSYLIAGLIGEIVEVRNIFLGAFLIIILILFKMVRFQGVKEIDY